jgi:hypothetical protein
MRYAHLAVLPLDAPYTAQLWRLQWRRIVEHKPLRLQRLLLLRGHLCYIYGCVSEFEGLSQARITESLSPGRLGHCTSAQEIRIFTSVTYTNSFVFQLAWFSEQDLVIWGLSQTSCFQYKQISAWRYFRNWQSLSWSGYFPPFTQGFIAAYTKVHPFFLARKPTSCSWPPHSRRLFF